MKKKAKQNPQKKTSQKNEIKWNIINSLLAGSLVFLGAFTDGDITQREIIASVGGALLIAITRFKEYWLKEKKEYSNNIFKFI